MSTSTHSDLQAEAVIVPITAGESILRDPEGEISIVLAREEISITHGRVAAGQPVAGRHIHHEHADAFYVLEGELTFEIGREANAITVGAGGFLAAPPGLAHSFGNSSDRPARCLSIHARDGGFAGFMRGKRDGVEVKWDIAPVPADGGLLASAAIVCRNPIEEHPEAENRSSLLWCSLPDLRVEHRRLHGSRALNLAPHDDRNSQIDTLLILDGPVEATLAGTTHTIEPGTLISVPQGTPCMLRQRERGAAHVVSLHTPNSWPAKSRFQTTAFTRTI